MEFPIDILMVKQTLQTFYKGETLSQTKNMQLENIAVVGKMHSI